MQTIRSGFLARLECHPELGRLVLPGGQCGHIEDELHAVTLHLLAELSGRLQFNALEIRLSAAQAYRMAVLDHRQCTPDPAFGLLAYVESGTSGTQLGLSLLRLGQRDTADNQAGADPARARISLRVM